MMVLVTGHLVRARFHFAPEIPLVVSVALVLAFFFLIGIESIDEVVPLFVLKTLRVDSKVGRLIKIYVKSKVGRLIEIFSRSKS